MREPALMSGNSVIRQTPTALCYACERSSRAIGNTVTSKLISRVPVLVFSLAPFGGHSEFWIWAQNGPGKKERAPPDVRCTLSVATHHWQIGRPAVISIELKNGASTPLDLSVIPVLYFGPKPGGQRADAGDYWSPVDIVANRALDTIQEKLEGNVGVSIKPKPLNLHLNKHGRATVKIDANETKWDRRISARWTALPFSKVVLPGAYFVGLDLEAATGNIRCNKVEVQIEAAAQ